MENIFKFMIGFAVVSFVFIVGIFVFIFKLAKKETNRREKIKMDKPKQRFEYVDFFFYHTASHDSQNDSRTYGYFIIRDVNTSVVYAIHNRFANVSFDFNSMFNNKKMELFLNTSPRKDIKFGDSGNFWISDKLNNDFYVRNGEKVKIGVEMFDYAGSIDGVDKINNYSVLYNLNSNYDISLLDKAVFIDGIVEFDINN